MTKLDSPHSSVGKESACNAGDPGSVPGLGRSAGEGIGYPLQYSWASLIAQLVKHPPAMQETWVRSLGHLGREWPLAKILACEGGLAGRGKGSPSSLKPPRPPQPYIDFSCTLCTRWRGLGLWPWRRGSGQGGGGKPLLNRHLYIYINNFSVHPTVGGKGREWRGLGKWGESNSEPCPVGAARTHPDQ